MPQGPIKLLIRRSIYTRWFYAFLVLVCILNVIAEVLDILDPGENLFLDIASLVLSGAAAFLAVLVFYDLSVRRTEK